MMVLADLSPVSGAITLLELQLEAFRESNGDPEKGSEYLKNITLELTEFMSSTIAP